MLIKGYTDKKKAAIKQPLMKLNVIYHLPNVLLIHALEIQNHLTQQ